MVYLEFNPRDFEAYWKFAQPTGNLVFRELDPKLQATMLRLLMDKKTSSSAMPSGLRPRAVRPPQVSRLPPVPCRSEPVRRNTSTGVIKRIIDNVNATDAQTVAGGQCIVSGTTELKDGAAVEAALYSMWRKCPKQIRKRSGLSIVMGWEAWDAYDQYITDKMVKYSENSEVNRYRFKGKRIIPITGVPEHTIVMGNFTSGMDSNLGMGVDYANDAEVLKVDRLQSNSSSSSSRCA